MALHFEQQQELTGFNKKIEGSSMDMIMDNLQKYQYQYPEKSTVREVTSNALDAVKERDLARRILTGVEKASDHYLERHEAVFEDSNFNPEYYDLGRLSTDANVYITYTERKMERDLLEIQDYGVGLGGKRLLGYFNLGFSTKRNTKSTLGKFGIGAKAGLSTGVDCYYMESTYNGLYTKWAVYSNKVNSLVPRLNLETGEENVRVDFEGGHYYAVRTDAFNGTTVSLDVKKHKRGSFLDAIKTQLMYFNNVVVRNVKDTGSVETINIKADKVFENENILIARRTIYSVPHILINNVNYGPIDFQELDLDSKKGNVGIKIPAEKLTINPSRESVIWDEQTKAAIAEGFLKAQAAAEMMIQDRLKETDYFKWQKAVESIKGGMYSSGDDDSDALKVLSKIVDPEMINYTFSPEPRIKAGIQATWGVSFRDYFQTIERVTKDGRNGTKKKLEKMDRILVPSDIFQQGTVVLYQESKEESYLRTLRYLFHTGAKRVVLFNFFDQGYTTVPLYCNPDQKEAAKKELDASYRRELFEGTNSKGWGGVSTQLMSQMQEVVISYMKQSNFLKPLSSIVVPDDFKYSAEDEVELDPEDNLPKPVEPTIAEIRKLEQRIVVRTPALDAYNPSFTWKIINPKVAEMKKWVGETYYCTKKNEAMLLVAASILIGPTAKYNQYKTDHYDPQPQWLKLPSESKMPSYVGTDIAGWPQFKKDYGNACAQGCNGAVFYYNRGPGAVGVMHDFHEITTPLVRLIAVSEDNVRHLPDTVRPIQEFFMTINEKNEVVIHKQLTRWFQNRKLSKVLENAEKYAKSQYFFNDRIKAIYNELKAEEDKFDTNKYIKSFDGNPALQEVTKFLAGALNLQKVCASTTDPEQIAQAATEFLGNPGIQGCHSFDLDLVNKIAELEEYHEQLGRLLKLVNWEQITGTEALMLYELATARNVEPWSFEPPYKLQPQVAAEPELA